MLNKPALAFLMASAAVSAVAQTITEIPAAKGRSAYVEDARGNIMRTPNGHCWRSALWTPADAVPGCDGDLAPPIVKPTAPAIVANPAPLVSAPAAVPAPRRCDLGVQFDSRALFAAGRSTLTAGGKKRIDDEVLAKLADCSGADNVLVVVRTGGASRMKAERALAASRARSVAQFLKSGKTAAPVKWRSAPFAGCSGQSGSKRPDCAAPSQQLEITAGTGKR